MPVVFQKFIYREDLKKNPKVMYLFGDNCERIGNGGQAKEMRGEPNAIGIRTKRNPAYNKDSFFTDEDFDEVKIMIYDDFMTAYDFVTRGGTIVIPSDGLGTGLAKLPTNAPMIYEEIETWIQDLVKAGEQFSGGVVG
jgi:hypothetical protein